MRGLAIISVAVVLNGPAAFAQATSPEVGFSSVPFQFFPPGARSLGMGSTFLAVADDATASASNPAGLVVLASPEASVHGRLVDLHGEGSDGFVRSAPTRAGLSFASVVVPRGMFRGAAYYQQASNFDVSNRTTSSSFRIGTESVPLRSDTRIDLRLDEVGISLAFRPVQKIAAGVSVARRRLRLAYENRNLIGAGVAQFGDRATADARDTATVFTAGVLVNPAGRLSVGAVLKKGGRFAVPFVVDFEGSPRGETRCPGPTCSAAAVQIPDVAGVGLAVRPSALWLFSVDVSRLRYSQLSDTPLRRVPIDLYPPATSIVPVSPLRDVTQLNAGAERVVSTSPVVVLRAGVERRPDFNPGGTVATAATIGTAGVGFVIRERVQVDLAAGRSKGQTEVLTSLAYRF